MKKFLSIIMITAICFGSFSITAFAQEEKTVYIFEYDGRCICYYKDEQDNPYILEDGIKSYIAIPKYIEKVTDESQLNALRNEAGSISLNLQRSAKSVLLFSQTIYFDDLPNTGILTVTEDYLYLKCSDLNPSGAKRGFSYWIFYTLDGSSWERAFYVNQSLLLYTKHPMALFGNAQKIKIEIFSYYGSVSSCLFSVKEGNAYGM